MSTLTQIETALQNIFGTADELARQTGFVQRVRPGKLTGKSFAGTLVLGLLQPGEVTMSDLSHFATHLHVQISAQAIQERFSRATAAFLQALLNVAFTQVVAADPVALPLLQRFGEVIVEDSSTFALPDACHQVWAGCGGSSQQGTQSAFKLQVRWDLLTGAFKGLALQDGRTPDTRSVLKGQRRQAKGVRIADLGYFDTAQFQEEAQADEYFFTRYKAGSVKLFDEQGAELDVLWLLKEKASEHAYECWVQVSATRRVPARLIAVPVPEEVAVKRQTGHKRRAQKHSRKPNATLMQLCHWTLMLTNIAQEQLTVQEALVLLRVRWQEELLFKLWKQVEQADTSRSKQPWHVLCDIYAKLLGVLIVHWLMIVGCWHIPSRSMVKASKAICSDIVLLARALGGKDPLKEVLQELSQGVTGCRMTSRKRVPNTYQLLLPQPVVSCKTAQPAVVELLT